MGGRYRIRQQLGAGGFGHTFLAQDLHLPGDPFCAVKQLKPQVNSPQDLKSAERLFEKEAQALYALGHHPQIPRLLAHFEEDHEFYLVQELIEGESLEVELKPETLWNDAQVIAFLSDLLGTLAFIHEHRVIHRDLKPSNLIRRQSDHRIVVIDFGAVKQVSLPLSKLTATMSRTISVGTRGYMPNEQLAGHPHFRSDIYAVGMISIQSLTGQHPASIHPHPQTGELDWHGLAPRSTPHLIKFLDYLIRYDFRSRYANAGEALEALQSLSKSESPPSPSVGLNLDLSSPPELASWTKTLTAQSFETNSSFFRAQTLPIEKDSAEIQTQKDDSEAKVQPYMSRKLVLPFAGLLLGCGLLAWKMNVSTLRVETATQPTERPASTFLAKTKAVDPVNPTQPASSSPKTSQLVSETQTSQRGLDSKAKLSEPRTANLPSVNLEGEPIKAGNALTVEAAQDIISDFYQHISYKNWSAAQSLFEGPLAQRFQPAFYEQFRRVTVDDYRVIHRSPHTVDLTIQNTYVYWDDSTQKEERSYKVQIIKERAHITGSAFVRVIKARSE